MTTPPTITDSTDGTQDLPAFEMLDTVDFDYMYEWLNDRAGEGYILQSFTTYPIPNDDAALQTNYVAVVRLQSDDRLHELEEMLVEQGRRIITLEQQLNAIRNNLTSQQ